MTQNVTPFEMLILNLKPKRRSEALKKKAAYCYSTINFFSTEPYRRYGKDLVGCVIDFSS